MNGNAQILEALKADNSGVGYVGAGYVLGDNIRELKILKIYSGMKAAISPLDGEQIRLRKYFFQRPLYQYYIASEYQKVKPFLDFEKSNEGMKIIESSGYYPVTNE